MESFIENTLVHVRIFPFDDFTYISKIKKGSATYLKVGERRIVKLNVNLIFIPIFVISLTFG